MLTLPILANHAIRHPRSTSPRICDGVVEQIQETPEESPEQNLTCTVCTLCTSSKCFVSDYVVLRRVSRGISSFGHAACPLQPLTGMTSSKGLAKSTKTMVQCDDNVTSMSLKKKFWIVLGHIKHIITNILECHI